MNKEEADKLAGKCGEPYWEKYALPNDLPSGFIFDENQLLAFANACEKIGMEKAAKICDEYPKRDPAEDGNGYWAAENCAAVIRAATQSPTPPARHIPAT